MANADMKVEVAAAMKSYLTSQDFKDIIVKSVKEAGSSCGEYFERVES